MGQNRLKHTVSYCRKRCQKGFKIWSNWPKNPPNIYKNTLKMIKAVQKYTSVQHRKTQLIYYPSQLFFTAVKENANLLNWVSHKSVSEQNISKNDNFKKAQKESKMGLKNLLVFIFEKSVNFYFDFAFKKSGILYSRVTASELFNQNHATSLTLSLTGG